MTTNTFEKIQITIDGDDITDSWTSIKIYQSIDSPTWSCELNLMDSKNLIENLPILHGSNLKILISTKDNCPTDDTIEFSFYIYNIGNKFSNNQNVETYTIKGVHKMFLLNNTIRINKKFKNSVITDSIQEIVSESFPDVSIDCPIPSEDTADSLICNWTPFISIGWLLKQAHKDNIADYLFFQSDLNDFTLGSIKSMYKDDSNKLEEIITYKVQNTGNSDPYNIIKHVWDHVDVQQNLQNGYYKSTVTSYDFLNKNWQETVHVNESEELKNEGKAKQWNDELFDNSEKAAIAFIPKMPNSFEGKTGYDQSDKWVASRKACLQRLDSEKFSAQLKGSVGTYKWLGKHIYIDLPSNDINGSDFYSRFRKGYYLTSAIVHYITPSMYLNNFEFVKMELE